MIFAMNVFNVFLQVIYLYNALVTDCAGSGRVILDLVPKDFTGKLDIQYG
jgi:hypothetical protein